MNTLMKTMAAVAGLLLLSGCAANAQDDTATNFGPGWRHQQMTEAWENGERGPGQMMMQSKMRGEMRAGGPGRNTKGGPGRMALNPDGTVDTTKLPEWCPYATEPEQK